MRTILIKLWDPEWTKRRKLIAGWIVYHLIAIVLIIDGLGARIAGTAGDRWSDAGNVQYGLAWVMLFITMSAVMAWFWSDHLQ